MVSNETLMPAQPSRLAILMDYRCKFESIELKTKYSVNTQLFVEPRLSSVGGHAAERVGSDHSVQALQQTQRVRADEASPRLSC